MTLQDHFPAPRLPPTPSPSYPTPRSLNVYIPTLPLERSPTTVQVKQEPLPRPIPPRTTSGVTSDGNDEDKGELTTKGRKRKRLAKACSACHKNKRRCDGLAPCSNCEFSSRPCLYLNAQGDQIPPPRTRDPSGAPLKADEKPFSTYHDRHPSGDFLLTERYHDPIDAVERDPSLSAELIDIYFKRVLPYATMFHPSTFHHRLYLNRVSPILLDIMYALAARRCEDACFLSTLPDTPAYGRGEAFADRAHRSARHFLDQRSKWADDEARCSRGTWEETELVQALYLLSVYFSLRQPGTSAFYLDAAINILRPTSSATLPLSPRLGLGTIEHLTLSEARSRTFWMLVLSDLCTAADGRPRRVQDHEMYNIPLPGGEAGWVRWGGAASGGREGGRREGMAVGTGTWAEEEGQVGEFGNVIRILSISSDIMGPVNGSGADSRSSPIQHEQVLKAWATNLPRHLRFDEVNLSLAMTKLSSGLPATSLSGWMYAYMHIIAECGMFYLQASATGCTVERQGQAVENIAVILEALGERGRDSPLMVVPVVIVSNWQERLHSASSPSAHQILLDERVVAWWTEIERATGMDRACLFEPNRGISISTSPRHTRPPPSSLGLGLYSTSPQPTLNSSTSSTITLPTPTGGYRLPPLGRPRAISASSSLLFPSPGSSRHRRLPSMSALSENGYKVDLPPLDNGFRYRPMSTFR